MKRRPILGLLMFAIAGLMIDCRQALADFTNSVGGQGGRGFYDEQGVSGVSRIRLRCGAYVDGIQFFYRDGTSSGYYGGQGGEVQDIDLGPDDKIVQISARSGQYVDALRFLVQRGTFGPQTFFSCGGAGGSYWRVLYPRDDGFIGTGPLGLYGSAGSFLDSIGFIYNANSFNIVIKTLIEPYDDQPGLKSFQAIHVSRFPEAGINGLVPVAKTSIHSTGDTYIPVSGGSIPIASTRDLFTDFARYDKILPGYTLDDYYYAPFEAVGQTASGIERLVNFVKDRLPLDFLPDVEIPSIDYAINFSLYKDGLYTYQVCSDSYPSYEIYYKPPGARSYFRAYKYTHPDLPTIVGIREVFERLQSPNCDVMTTTGVMSPDIDGQTYNPFADFPGPE